MRNRPCHRDCLLFPDAAPWDPTRTFLLILVVLLVSSGTLLAVGHSIQVAVSSTAAVAMVAAEVLWRVTACRQARRRS
jgi:hypothetical protein